MLRTTHLLLLPFFQLFREVRIMKGLNHPNIGEDREGWGGAQGEESQGVAGLAVTLDLFSHSGSLLAGSVALAKSLNLSEHQCPPLQRG